MSMDGLIGQADEALYAAKRAGKDRVVAAPMQAAA
jgi:PleD family two-component response regulator